MTSDRNRSIGVWSFAKPKRKQVDLFKSLKIKVEQVFNKTVVVFFLYLFTRCLERRITQKRATFFSIFKSDFQTSPFI